jgi:hypothetical protein
VGRLDGWRPSRAGRGLGVVACVVVVLVGGGCTSWADREQRAAAREVAGWPLRGNLAGDRALLDDARRRLDADGREPGRVLVVTWVEGVTLVVAETKAGAGSFVAVYGRSGTPVRAMRVVDLGRPTSVASLSLGIDNAAVALVVPAPRVTRAIKTGVDTQGQPVMVEVPIRDGVAALRLNGQRPANTLIDVAVEGQAVGSLPELQAMDVDDPVKAQPNFKPGLDDDAGPPASESYRRDNVALGLFLALVALGVAAFLAPNLARHLAPSRFRDGLSVDASGSAGRRRWSVPAVAAIVLALVVPLVVWAASAAMFDLSYSDPFFDVSGLWLQFVPAVLVGGAAIRCAHAGLRQTRKRTGGRVLAVTAAVFAYLVAGLMLAALLTVFYSLGGAGG